MQFALVPFGDQMASLEMLKWLEMSEGLLCSLDKQFEGVVLLYNQNSSSEKYR